MKSKTIRKSFIAVCTLTCAISAVCGVEMMNAEIAQATAQAEFTVSMKEGASLRIGEEDGQNGLTYTVTMPKTEYETLMENVGEGKKYKEVEFGVLIAPYAYHTYKALDETNVFGASAFYDYAEWTEGQDGKYEWVYNGDKVRIMNFTADTMELENATDTYYSYAGSIVNILDGTNEDETNPNLLNNLTNEFYGVGYVKTVLNSDNSVDYVFAEDNTNNVSPAYIAQRAVAEDTTLTVDQKTWLTTNYINKVNTGKTEEEIAAEKINSYTIEKYFANSDGEYVLDESKTETVAVENFSYGTRITAATKVYSGYQLNLDKTGSLIRDVYFNGKLCVKQYYDKVELVDKSTATTYDLTSAMSENAKTAIAAASDVTYTLTAANNADNVKTFTESTVTLSELTNGAYTLEVLSGEEVLYTGTQIDIYDGASTAFEWIDETAFADSFIKSYHVNTNYHTAATATEEEKAAIGMSGTSVKVSYTRAPMYARVKIANLIHTDEYYITNFGDRTFRYDYYFTEDGRNTTTLSATYDGVYANRKDFTIGTLGTVEISLADFIKEPNERKMLSVMNGYSSGCNGAIYYGNFRLAKEVSKYEETAITMFDKNEKSVAAVAWSELMSAAGAEHVVSYDNLTYTLTEQNTNTKLADYTTNTVDLTDLSGLYVLTVATGSDVIYSGVVDIFNSTVFEFLDESIFVESFEKSATNWNSANTLSVATTDELSAIGMDTSATTLKQSYTHGAMYARVKIVKLMHSDEYYTTYFGERTLQYDFYMTEGTKVSGDTSTNATALSVNHTGSGNTSRAVDTKHTLEITISTLFGNEKKMAAVTNGDNTSASIGAIYIGNFRLAE